MFQGSLKSVFMKFEGYLMKASRIGNFRGSFNKVSVGFQGRVMGALRMFQGHFKKFDSCLGETSIKKNGKKDDIVHLSIYPHPPGLIVRAERVTNHIN